MSEENEKPQAKTTGTIIYKTLDEVCPITYSERFDPNGTPTTLDAALEEIAMLRQMLATMRMVAIRIPTQLDNGHFSPIFTAIGVDEFEFTKRVMEMLRDLLVAEGSAVTVSQPETQPEPKDQAETEDFSKIELFPSFRIKRKAFPQKGDIYIAPFSKLPTYDLRSYGIAEEDMLFEAYILESRPEPETQPQPEPQPESQAETEDFSKIELSPPFYIKCKGFPKKDQMYLDPCSPLPTYDLRRYLIADSDRNFETYILGTRHDTEGWGKNARA